MTNIQTQRNQRQLDSITSSLKRIQVKPDPPRGVSCKDGVVSWEEPKELSNVTHYNVYLNSEDNMVMRVPQGQTTASGLVGHRAMVSSYNANSGLESAKAILDQQVGDSGPAVIDGADIIPDSITMDSIADGTLDLTKIDFSKVSTVLGIFEKLFDILPASIDTSKISYIDFAKITNCIITNAMIQNLDVGKLVGTSATFTALSIFAGAFSAGLQLGAGGAVMSTSGGSLTMGSTSTSLSGVTALTLYGLNMYLNANVYSISAPAAFRAALGLGTAATQPSTNFATHGDVLSLQSADSGLQSQINSNVSEINTIMWSFQSMENELASLSSRVTALGG